MFTCSVCCLLLFSLAVLTVGSLKCIENWPGRTCWDRGDAVQSWERSVEPRTLLAFRLAGKVLNHLLQGLVALWQSCWPPALAGLCPGSHRNPLLRLFTGTRACLKLRGCPAPSCGIEDVLPVTPKAALTIRAIYIHSFCYLCALLCPGEFCSSLPAFRHKYPQWGLQIHTSLENWHVILRAAMQHPNYTSHKAWKRKWASNIK